MFRGLIQWWQSRTVSAAPVAGWTSSAGKGSTTSAGPFSQWTLNVIVPLQVPGDGGVQEPEWLTVSQCCSWWWVGESRGVSSEVHDHLHCFDRVKLQVVKTAPDSQILNLLSVSRLVTVLDEADQCGVVCKLQELDRGVFRCAVIRVQGEEQWGEHTALWSSGADRAGAGWEFSQPHYLLLVCQEAGDPLIDGGGNGELCQFILKGVRIGMMVLKAELKSTNRILT